MAVIKCRSLVATSVLLTVLAAAHDLGAQSVVNPKTVEFDPSADNSALTSGGLPMVQRYDLQIYLVGATQPVSTTSLGKPAPDPDGKIRVDFSTLVLGWPLANGNYEARVAAVGPAGSGVSSASNPFSFVNCAYGISPASQAFADSGGTGTISVTAGAGCTWSASAGAPWLTLGTTAGAGSAGLPYTVAANASGAARSATLTVAGQTFTVSQAAGVAAACSYALSPVAKTLDASGGASSFAVSASAGCAWTATSAASWITLTTASGSGPGTVTFNAARNKTSSARSGTIALTSGGAFTVTETATTKPNPPHNIRVSTVQAP